MPTRPGGHVRGPAPCTVAVLQEDGDGEGADLALHARCELGVHRADDAQGLHHQVEDLGAELGREVDQAVQDAGQEGPQHGCALRDFQLVAVAGERDKRGSSAAGPAPAIPSAGPATGFTKLLLELARI